VGITQQEARDAIVGSPAPILFIDTCIFLDIVRSPVRDNIDANSAQLAQTLCTYAQKTPREVWLVTSATVRAEWLENIPNVKLEVSREIRKLEKRRRHFLSSAAAANSVQYAYGISEGSLQLEARLESISRALLDECLVIAPEDIHLIRAMQRIKQYRPPSRRGKSEPKDCEIFEVFLGLCGEFRTTGFHEKLLFASSNTTDYAGDNAAGIEQELNEVNGKFVDSLPWAVAAIEGRA